ncbi:MAG: zinc-ribbon domain-containing protein [Methanobrevibacter thaueri]|uniref:Zinc-ribbon domain-containing protein n=1 Tax=Methanobrevibacter thaueri TaxID=190975 RepID=A0A8T3V7Q6_9EURY|nr:zinc-ribbon domain-containing protein [Methanobrevibacter thaueri]MBE6500930.1 zinc-ribbon domain-containing protein [Methanobrevibacter thaueri]
MVKCQNCGEEVVDGAKFCKNCGSEIVIDEEVDETGTKFCSNCGFEMPNSTKFCPECGTATAKASQVVNTSSSVMRTDKSPGLAAILSFLIIGLGQVYLGLTKKGIILFVLAIISGALMLFVIGWITWLLVWGYAIYDAYNSGEKMRNGIDVEDTLDINNLF